MDKIILCNDAKYTLLNASWQNQRINQSHLHFDRRKN